MRPDANGHHASTLPPPRTRHAPLTLILGPTRPDPTQLTHRTGGAMASPTCLKNISPYSLPPCSVWTRAHFPIPTLSLPLRLSTGEFPPPLPHATRPFKSQAPTPHPESPLDPPTHRCDRTGHDGTGRDVTCYGNSCLFGRHFSIPLTTMLRFDSRHFPRRPLFPLLLPLP
jgi:hypothetical protein